MFQIRHLNQTVLIQVYYQFTLGFQQMLMLSGKYRQTEGEGEEQFTMKRWQQMMNKNLSSHYRNITQGNKKETSPAACDVMCLSLVLHEDLPSCWSDTWATVCLTKLEVNLPRSIMCMSKQECWSQTSWFPPMKSMLSAITGIFAFKEYYSGKKRYYSPNNVSRKWRSGLYDWLRTKYSILVTEWTNWC